FPRNDKRYLLNSISKEVLQFRFAREASNSIKRSGQSNFIRYGTASAVIGVVFYGYISSNDIHLDSSLMSPTEWRKRFNTIQSSASSDLSEISEETFISKKKKLEKKPNVPKIFTWEEVSKHNSKENGIWIISGSSVYDITEFVEAHPGGERIMLAAGRSIDPFWAVFTIHKSPQTLEILNEYKIGELDIRTKPPDEKDTKEALELLFANEPHRNPALIVRSARPCNAETPASNLNDFITPNENFFVRNHLPVPLVDEKSFALKLQIPNSKNQFSTTTVTYTLDDLKTNFPKTSIAATLQCAGNRRSDMSSFKATQGLQWENGAIGTAVWSGVLLRDVLQASGLTSNLANITGKHVVVSGADGYGASIPLRKAEMDAGDVMLAYEMNGESIPRDHGAPLRLVVPGNVAARSVKWVSTIEVTDDESYSHWQRKDYKGFNPSKVEITNDDYEAAKSIQEMPVQSAILSPRSGDVVNGNAVLVEGYAWSGGGRGINRVDVSVDGGKTWLEAKIQEANVPITGGTESDSLENRRWAWTKWQAEIGLDSTQKGEFEIVCKAIDSSYNVQPENMVGIYNQRGVLVNGWHRVH
ncbi:hypothetical protein HK096_008610, partial [Nowakowskiella sp. JEL0078]